MTAAGKRAVPFDEDVWELYDMSTDFGHATDLAAEHPEKLAELQALFDREARKYNVYPMADNIVELLTAERPRLVSGNKASYGPGTVRLPEDAVINIKNRSFSIIAEVDNPDGNAEGMLVTLGGETGGYALVVLEGKPTFHYNWLGRERYTITVVDTAAQGRVHDSLRLRLRRRRRGQRRHRHAVGQRQEGGRRPHRENGAGLLLDRRHLRRRRGLGHARVADLRASVQVHRHTEEGDGAGSVAVAVRCR